MVRDSTIVKVWSACWKQPSLLLSSDIRLINDDITSLVTTAADKRRRSAFYRAMHSSAKRGIAIACRLSVCLSVCPSVCLSVCNVGGL